MNLDAHPNVLLEKLLLQVYTSDKGGGKCFRPRLYVCLSVNKITQKRMHGFG